ncbi:MAG: peptide deformylase [Elusimicrobiota bacterium]
MKIVYYPDSSLRKKTVKITDEDIDSLYQELITGMINYDGIGLAGPQIGINKSAAVISNNADNSLVRPLLLVNPEILESSGEQTMEEGCLSVIGVNADITRSYRIKVEHGKDGERKQLEAEGLLAVIIQHEVDHLNGILFPDHLKFFKRLWCFFKARLNKFKKRKSL